MTTALTSPYLILAEEDHSLFGIHVVLPDFESPDEAEGSFDQFDWFERPDLARQCIMGHAAFELRKTLCQMIQVDECGPENFSWLSERDERENVIVMEAGDEDSDGFQMKAVKSESGQTLLLRGESATGCLYAVYYLLEQLGCRWTGMGDRSVDIPWLSRLQIKPMDLQETPDFRIRGFWPDPYTFEPGRQRGHFELFQWMARHRMNFWSVDDSSASPGAMRQYGFRLTAGAGGFGQILSPETLVESPEEERRDDEATDDSSAEESADSETLSRSTLYEEHPDWFGTDEAGAREQPHQPLGATNFCTSNSDAVEFFLNEVVERLSSDPRWTQADSFTLRSELNGKWCACQGCLRLGTPVERLLSLAEQCHARLESAFEQGRFHRRVQLRIVIENETLASPPSIVPKALVDHATFELLIEERCHAHAIDEDCELNAPIHECLDKWRTVLGPDADICVGECHNGHLDRDLPIIHRRTMNRDVRYFHGLGVREIHSRHVARYMWGPMTLNNFLFAKLTWDQEQDVELLCNRFFRACYGPAFKEAAALYGVLELALCNTTMWKTDFVKRLRARERELFATSHLPYSGDSYPPSVEQTMKLLIETGRHLGEALEKAESSDLGAQARIMQEDLPLIEYAQNTFFLFETLSRALSFSDESVSNELVDEVEGWAGCLLEQVFDQTGLGIESPLGWTTGIEASLVEDVVRAWLAKHGRELVVKEEEEE